MKLSHIVQPENQWSCKRSPDVDIWSRLVLGKPRVIIHINFVELESLMLHAKFQDHRTLGTRDKDFLRFLPCNYMHRHSTFGPTFFIYIYIYFKYFPLIFTSSVSLASLLWLYIESAHNYNTFNQCMSCV